MSAQLTYLEDVTVPYAQMAAWADKYSSTSTLNMYQPTRSRGKVFTWRNKTWTCTGYVSQHLRDQSMDLREVVPVEHYTGPQRDPSKRGSDFYLGGTFVCKGQTWGMTAHKVVLRPTPEAAPAPGQLALW